MNYRSFANVVTAANIADKESRPAVVVSHFRMRTMGTAPTAYGAEYLERALELQDSMPGHYAIVYLNDAALAELLPTEEPEPWYKTEAGKANIQRALDSTASAIAQAGPVLEQMVKEAEAEEEAERDLYLLTGMQPPEQRAWNEARKHQCRECGQSLQDMIPEAIHLVEDSQGTQSYLCDGCFDLWLEASGAQELDGTPYVAEVHREDPDNPGPPPGTIEGPEEPEPMVPDPCVACGQPIAYIFGDGWQTHTHDPHRLEELLRGRVSRASVAAGTQPRINGVLQEGWYSCSACQYTWLPGPGEGSGPCGRCAKEIATTVLELEALRPSWSPASTPWLERLLEQATAHQAGSYGLRLLRLQEEAKDLPKIVECPNCLFQHQEGTECPVCSGDWERAQATSQERAWKSEGQHPAIMRYLKRVQRHHQQSVWGKPTTRVHWMAQYECPVCGRLHLELANTTGGRRLICTGTRVHWDTEELMQARGLHTRCQRCGKVFSEPSRVPTICTECSRLEAPQESPEPFQLGGLEPAPEPDPKTWDYSQGPMPAPVAGLMAELEGQPGLTEEQYQQMRINTSQWSAELEQSRAEREGALVRKYPHLEPRLPEPQEPDRVPPALRPVVAVALVKQISGHEEGWGLWTALERLTPATEQYQGTSTRAEAVEGAVSWAEAQGAGALKLTIEFSHQRAG